MNRQMQAGTIIVGVVFILIGIAFLGIHSTSTITASFNLYVGEGFILVGILFLAYGIFSLVHH